MLGAVPFTREPVPAFIQALARDWAAMIELEDRTNRLATEDDADEGSDLWYAAWRWLGERSPWLGYLAATPRFSFLRFGDPDVVRIGFYDRGSEIDGIPAWTSGIGYVDVDARAFEEEVAQFPVRLLDEMGRRIEDVEAGRARCQVPVDVVSLRKEHAQWTRELSADRPSGTPDFSWEATATALRRLAERYGLAVPG